MMKTNEQYDSMTKQIAYQVLEAVKGEDTQIKVQLIQTVMARVQRALVGERDQRNHGLVIDGADLVKDVPERVPESPVELAVEVIPESAPTVNTPEETKEAGQPEEPSAAL